MYVHDTLLGQPAGKRYKAPLTQGDGLIREAHTKDLLTIIQGPSPFQSPIQRAAQRVALPAKWFHVLSSPRHAPAHLRPVLSQQHGAGKMVGGTIDRCTNSVYMVELPSENNATRLEFALHELVHLFARGDVPRVNCASIIVGRFQRIFGRGIGEGVTQAFTEDLMKQQGITLAKERVYKAFTPAAREFIKIFGPDEVAAAYFGDDALPLLQRVQRRWGIAWAQVARLVTAGNSGDAIGEMQKLEAAYIKRMMQGGPKGDFPTPSPVRNYA